MPNLVNNGSSSVSNPTLIRTWDPSVEEIQIGDKFYGIKYYQSNGKLVIQEINDSTVPIDIPDYRVGDSLITGNITTYQGGETFANAVSNLDEGDIFEPYNEEVYKNWFTSYTRVSFSWYTSGGGSKPGHLLMEFE
jgi:hypothetical protein